MQNLDQLNKMLVSLKQNRENTNKMLRNSPKGEIHVFKRGKGLIFLNYYHENKKLIRKGIRTNPRLINELLLKDYLKVKRQLYDEDIQTIENAIAQMHTDYLEESIAKLPSRCHAPHRSLFEEFEKANHTTPCPDNSSNLYAQPVKTHIKPGEISKWAVSPYRANSSFFQYKIHKATNGLFVRSKSELSLMEWYSSNVRAFHYDELLQVLGQWVSPDFIFARADGSLIFHEHWGLTTNQEYINKNINKLYIYAQAGVFPGQNLIITTDNEDGSIDMELIENLLDAYGANW